jgi:signal transduction histidine kinase
MGLIRKELKGFHELRTPMLGYVVADRRPMLLFFQGKQVVERSARDMWSARSRIRQNEYEDRIYLANEFGRPFAKVLAIPLKRRAVASDQSDESPATLFFEHALPDEKVEPFLNFISERLQPLAIALDRILLEYHLKYTSVQWESTFDGIKDPIAIIDIDFNVVRANRHFTLSGNRSYDRTCFKAFSGAESMCRGCPVGQALQTGEPQKGQVRRGSRVFDVLSYPIRLHDDRASTNVINHYVDVTASRELHSRMIQGEKMAAIGLLAGNIAHELNNPLTGIRSLAQVLITEIPQDGTLSGDVKEVEKAAERSQKIIENLLDFSKGETDQKQTRISLNEIVSRTLPMLKTAMREHRSDIVLSEDENEVRVEPHLMQQVVFNLVNNACQAMVDPGQISIETDLVVEPNGAKWCELHVRDTGPGIPVEIIESIFEPFFTTKEKGQGTGLGLSMSQSIIQKFGGEIRVQSKVGEGSQFTVRLPSAKE